ncbi:hypothetical protein [Sphingobacterium deserti]|uniref:Uncharacterized protein n=1 Tax=Sphingobacterium deserti TaxID=1229276 RepID=A0A0B8TAG7_9SPHI|nr:hypothetical protein [Sphingobacterium deserti]KGE15849.1 hypothetical protein DI53_0402 [Sphingobacterium deserti]
MDFSSSFPVRLYDFKSFLKSNVSTQKQDVINQILDQAVIYKVNTPTFLGNEINEFCGVTVSYLKKDDPYFDYYRTLNWWIDGH